MKGKLLAVTVIVINISLLLTITGSAKQTFGDMIIQNGNTINLNINKAEPATLDPALATDTNSVFVIDQLFSGLVRVDEDTGEVLPNLASSWTIDSSGTIFTFNLRSGLKWSDGTSLNANDVRYGILRTLDPANDANYASSLYIIKNAEDYNKGIISDPNQVGATVVNDTTLVITMEYPSSNAISKLALWFARPMPKNAIDTYGDDWTEPGKIVTSGPYLLSEWDHDDHILLQKNPSFYDASNVKIEKVKLWMVDITEAWEMYLDDRLAMVSPTNSQLDIARNDPILKQQVHISPDACTYYYGFSISEEPFDNVLVRKAFIAATNRRGLISAVTGGSQQPALTYTPPDIFGHVDGYAENVGIPYNPNQARQWLSDAGYPNGQGLPAITLWYNTSEGHQAIAEYIRNSWHDVLGVNVSLQHISWNDYLDQLGKGEFQVWRNGWCMDYPDAYNFLHDGISKSNFGNWSNPTYDNLLEQATHESNSDTIKSLYKQAEEILVETDAVMLPLYYYTSVTLDKPYLLRKYGSGFDYIAEWRVTKVAQEVPKSGGQIISEDTNTTLEFGNDTFSETVVMTYTPSSPYNAGVPSVSGIMSTSGNAYYDIGHCYDLSAVYKSNGQAAQIESGKTYNVSITYTNEEKGPAIENTLALFYWNGSKWILEISSEVDIVNNIVTATPDHLSLWTILGETINLNLPFVTKGY
jgi:oligopeptide transport system substrate-binding protein